MTRIRAGHVSGLRRTPLPRTPMNRRVTRPIRTARPRTYLLEASRAPRRGLTEADGLHVVPVGIEDEGGVVAFPVVRPGTRGAVVSSSRPEGRGAGGGHRPGRSEERVSGHPRA